MEKVINAYTEASDADFHLTRTSLYSFIRCNPWFNGTVFLLVHPTNNLSIKNHDTLLSIYPKLKIKSELSHPIFTALDRYKNKVQYPELMRSALKWTVFSDSELTENVMYFTNQSVFQKNCESIFTRNLGKQASSVQFFNFDEKISIPQEVYDNLSNKILTSLVLDDELNHYLNSKLDPTFYLDSIFSFSSECPNSKFITAKSSLNHKSIIFFNTLNSSLQYSKINQLWLFKNKESSQFLTNPKSFNSAGTNMKKLRALHSKAIRKTHTPSRTTNLTVSQINLKLGKKVIIDKSEAFHFFKEKSICLVANSSDLLKYEYGNFIDSHDIVIRFNGYKIIPEKTGIKTDVHCVFREFTQGDPYLTFLKIIISKDRKQWVDSIFSFHGKQAVNNNQKILDFNYPSDSQLTAANCGNIRIPTSGLCVYSLLVSLGLVKNVRLIGFNGYNGGDPSCILRENRDTQLANAHDYQAESRYWKKNFVSILPGVLKNAPK